MDKKSKPTGKHGSLLPLLPLRDIVIFPGMASPLFVGRNKSIKAVDDAIDNNDSIIFLATQKVASDELPEPEGIHSTGCVCEIVQVFKMPDGTVKIMVEGLARATIEEYVSKDAFFTAKIKQVVSSPSEKLDRELEILSHSIRHNFERFSKGDAQLPPYAVQSMAEISDAEELGDYVMGHLGFQAKERQSVLECGQLKKRLEMILDLIEKEIEISEIERRVKGRVKKQMDKSQREYYLTEQMKAIHKELGRTDPKTETEELYAKVKTSGMPLEIKEKTEKEISRLSQMPSMSAESTVARNYIDWLLDIPWSERSEDKNDTIAAEAQLNKDHHGLEDVKERILDYLAVKQLSGSKRGPILCLVGPPGVGKTSLGRSIATALNRKFVRVSLGGVRDDAEIRGHRRTYIGALPGRIIQSMKKAKTVNPIMMLDEIDKISSDFRGDPASALLEVLDPEQNKNFSDHYLEVDYNLSEVIFITTANSLSSMPSPLLDRMEVIQIAGYTEEEKMQIAKKFLLPKQIKEHGLRKSQISISSSMMMKVVSGYTREAGVRNLERTLATLCRKVARCIIDKKSYNRSLNIEDVTKFLGPIKFQREKAKAHKESGLAFGLAWTRVGGEMMNVEVAVVPGKGVLHLTGKLGDVMQESARAALTYIRSRADRFGLDPEFYTKSDIHIHLPEGAIPKDGPSAGITMASAMASAFCKVPLRHDVAMTGEITLRGKVLAIGGLKEKALAAHRAGIKEIIIPAENEKDLVKFPEVLLKGVKFTPVSDMDEVLQVVAIKKMFRTAPPRPKKQATPSDHQGVN